MGAQNLPDSFEFNNGDKKIYFDKLPCEDCFHNTYIPGYYTYKSGFCLECSVYKSSKRWCQFSKKEVKNGSKKLCRRTN